MHRTFVLGPIIFGFLIAPVMAREASSFRAGAQPESKKVLEPESRAKIIDEIRSDLGDVVEKLNKNDSGARTRAQQNRIVKNIEKLLDDDDDPPSSPSGNNANSPPPPPPGGKENPQSKSQSAPQPESKQQPTPQSKQAPTPKASQPSGADSEVAKTPKVEPRIPASPDYWPPPLPRRYQQDVDALSRGRFMPRYEDLLREYYRSLGESRRGDE